MAPLPAAPIHSGSAVLELHSDDVACRLGLRVEVTRRCPQSDNVMHPARVTTVDNRSVPTVSETTPTARPPRLSVTCPFLAITGLLGGRNGFARTRRSVRFAGAPCWFATRPRRRLPRPTVTGIGRALAASSRLLRDRPFGHARPTVTGGRPAMLWAVTWPNPRVHLVMRRSPRPARSSRRSGNWSATPHPVGHPSGPGAGRRPVRPARPRRGERGQVSAPVAR